MKIFAIVLLLVVAGCEWPSAKKPAEFCSMEPPTSSSEGEKCMFRAVASRCNATDQCLVQCWKKKTGRGVAGGCYRLCPDSVTTDWAPPESAKGCPLD